MTPADSAGLAGQTATALAALVRAGQVSPVEVVRAHLARIAALDERVGAFQLVRGEKALAEAEALAARADLRSLPLAGVPVAIKDNVHVAGEPMRRGSSATPETAGEADHEIVRRLRSAGAIVVGKTRVPELGVWGTTDSAFAVTRNPWNLERTPGGSSGGSAAAVAAAMVPVAHGNDGLGSIRIPAAACGLFGIKPGAGVVPSELGPNSWFGMAENGPLATTVDDAALVLSVLAECPELREPAPPERPLRVAVSTRSPMRGVNAGPEVRSATIETARLLAGAGHHVEAADPPYPIRSAVAILARWTAGAARETDGLDPARLEPRTRRHAQLGRIAERLGLIKPGDREAWRALLGSFFASCDVLLTPALATPPIRAEAWGRRSWSANLIANARFAPFTAPWNFAGYPAAAVPAGLHPDGTPLSVQLVAPPGGEALVLSVAKQLEMLRPWRRHAPLAG
ncbi:MAG: amidase [Gemmatimonadetes bacterium]|nr:amidase [Gemmatimonadota bacterium]